jgi:hypothetical protein
MKKLLAFVFFAGWALLAVAQEQESSTLERKTVFKFLPVNLPFESYSFEIERMINAKNAITLGFGIPTNQSIMGKYGMDASSDVKEAKIGTMHIRAAYRHYAGKSMLPKGFYIEPYLKYQQINAEAQLTFTKDVQNSTPVTYTADLTTPKLNTLNLGFQMGVQFLIAKRVSLDFYFLGLEAGMLSGSLNARVNPKDNIPDMKDEIEKSINDLPGFLRKKLEVTSTSDAVNVKASSVPYPWFRSGLSIGIAF